MATNFIGVLLPNTPNYIVGTGFSTQLYDATGAHTITVEPGASLQLTGSLGNNLLRLPGKTSAWQVYRDGSTVVLTSTDSSRIELPATRDIQTLQFDDGDRALQIVISSGSPALKLGTQTLTAQATAIAAVEATPPTNPTPGEGSTTKTPWTLVMQGAGSGFGERELLVSDGSAAGTETKIINGLGFEKQLEFKINADQTGAYFYNPAGFYYNGGVVGYTDGTVAGTQAIVTNASAPSRYVSMLNTHLVIPESTKSYAINGPQNTFTSITLDYSFSDGLHDEANQNIWSSVYSSPYGRELVKFDYSNPSQITAVMVKDINPGSSSGMDTLGAILPNGKLIFSADDGIHGREAWVSDGTEAGTFMLKNYHQGSYGEVHSFKTYGDQVAFVASSYESGFNAAYAGRELVFTDGTREGTTLLDINPGTADSTPNILGEANGLLYFTASARNANTGVTEKGIYSTNGTTFTKLAPIQSDASLLGWDSNQAFFKVSDSTHGAELWVANFSTNRFSLVKDILAGSGSALADANNSSTNAPQMVAGKLIFTAYTSATQQGLFVSDGTEAGTVQMGNSAPTQSKVIGNTLVFANAEGVFAVNLGAAIPAAVQLSSVGLSTTSSAPLQTDADQAFYLTRSGELFSTTGATAPAAPLASQVTQFKVVAEDAVFFIQRNAANGTDALWYSDGTATGTRLIEDLPSGSAFDLSNAVAIRTAGQPLPPDSVAPLFRNAHVNGNQLTLHYADTGNLDATNRPAAGAFALGGTTATVSSVAVDATAKTVTLTLSEAVKSTDSVTVSYTDPSANNDQAAIQDAAGNDAASFSNRFVTNQTPDNVAPVFGSASVNGATLTLTYSDASLLDATNKPAASAFALDGTTATVSNVAVDAAAKTVTLTLSEAVKSTDTVTVSYTDPTAGNDTAALQDALGNDAATLVNQVVSNLTPAEQVKSPWTLVAFNSNSFFYSSDGTDLGTGQISSKFGYVYEISPTSDKKSVVFLSEIFDNTKQQYTWAVFRTDGTEVGTQPLSTNFSYHSGNPVLIGKNLVFGDYNYSGYNGLITDGTVAGTKVVADLPLGIVDKTNQTMWATLSTAPYGTELFRIDLKASSPAYSMVKDINPGSSGSMGSIGALLPNGKLIFSANDGTNGREAWVSDGTEAGTFMLKNYYAGNYGEVSNFRNYGDKVAFVAYSDNSNEGIPSAGYELAFTDGTTEGTTLLDINPGYQSSNPNILGEANGLLYFTADVTENNVTTKGIFSTNGTTFTKLATIQSDAALLGWDTNKAFFRVSDAQNGSELWAADFGTNGFGLVKDILGGSGSGLAGDTQAFMVGGKLVFKAYTSATQQNLFVSDGTVAGTTQVGSTLGTYHTLGDTLVFADGAQVRGMDLSAGTPSPVSLVTGDSALAKLQFDADQVFFTLANGDLYATQGTLATTVKLATNVSNFKVVEENALYWVQTSQQSTTGYKLGYSDGTAAGTRVIEDAPAPIVQALDNAVAIQTVGVAPL